MSKSLGGQELKQEEEQLELSTPLDKRAEEEKKEAEKVKKAEKVAKKKRFYEMTNRADFVMAVGDEKRIKLIEDSLDKFCEEYAFDKIEFVKNFLAFRLFRKVANSKQDRWQHMDWIDLNDINKRFDLRLPQFKGAIRKYQKPLKRAYRGA